MIDNKKEAIIFRQVKYTIIDCLQDDYDEEDFQVVVDTREQCIINWDLGKIEIDFKNKYITLNDDMTFVFDEYGYFKEKTISITMSGITGAEKIKQLMTSLRQEAPTSFGGVQVEAVEDYQASTKTRNNGEVEPIDFDQADVLKYYLADGSWIAARPSGTIEPRAMGTRCPAPTTQGPRPKDQAPAARGMRTQHPAPSTHDPRTRPQGETGVSHRCRGGLAR